MSQAKRSTTTFIHLLVVFVQIFSLLSVGTLTAVLPAPIPAQASAVNITNMAGVTAPNCATSAPMSWQNTIGGSGDDELYSVQPTSDGGYILGGYSDSGISGDKIEASQGGSDYWVVKLDSSGAIEWQNTIGGSGFDTLASVQQTSDGGYILGGVSLSGISGDKTEASQGGSDYWVVKLDSTGQTIQWQNTIGGSFSDNLASLQQTSDGGYVLLGYSTSGISGDKTEANQGSDYWVVKVNSIGAIQWQNTIGGSGADDPLSVQQTSDGGYILGGYSDSAISGDKTEASLGTDYWVVKLNSSGTIQWQNTLGGSGTDILTSLAQTSDGGYVLGGRSASGISGDKSEPFIGGTGFFASDYWVVKLDSLGQTIQWQNTIGGTGNDLLTSLQQTNDGGYMLGGRSDSGLSGDKSEASQGVEDYWVLKLDSLGQTIQWQNTIGGSGTDILTSLAQTSDGNYILGGYSASSISSDKTEASQGTNDYWVVRLVPVDHGDAPDSYGTRYASNGPRHCVIPGLRMGALADAETDIVPSAAANSDDTQTGSPADDEDGVASFPALGTGSTSYSLNVTVVNTTGGAANLFGWIDFNLNGTFQASEATSVSVPNGATSATLSWSGLSGLVSGQSYVRLRLTTDASITTSTSGGYATDGEVEDYALSITLPSISGAVFEDITGDQLADGDLILTDASGDQRARNAANVCLLLDNGDNTPNASDTLSSCQTTTASGQYTFTSVANGTYWVAVQASTLTPSAGGAGLAEQSYGGIGSLCNSVTPSVAAGACYGGKAGATADGFAATAATLANAEHIAKVTLAGADVSNLNFGFSFNVVSNVNDTGQGSLRRFVTNANSVTGANAMRFVPAVATNDSGGGGNWWKITLASLLPVITGANGASTTLDGAAYNNTDGATVLDTNPGNLKPATVVGTGSDQATIPALARPELEVFKTSNTGFGAMTNSIVEVAASNVTVQRLSITGGSESVTMRTANITGLWVRDNALGYDPNGAADVPIAGPIPNGANVLVGSTNTAACAGIAGSRLTSTHNSKSGRQPCRKAAICGGNGPCVR